MKTTNIENITVFRDRGTYGYSVRYKSGRHRTICTSLSNLPKTIHKFINESPYSISHDDAFLDYHEVIYYNRDIRT